MTPLEKIIAQFNKGIEIHKKEVESKSTSPMYKFAADRLWGQCNSIISVCESMLEEEKNAYAKADLLDKIDAEIAPYYDEEDARYDEEMGLLTIGEIVAEHLGYL